MKTNEPTPATTPKFRSYRARYAGQTTTKPSRVIVTDMQTGDRVTLSKDGTTAGTAEQHLKQCGVQLAGMADDDTNGDIIFFSSGPYVDIRRK